MKFWNGAGATFAFSNGAVALPNTTIQASLSPLLLDARGSTGTGALTYPWSAASGTPVAFVSTDTAGEILVQFPGPGGYTIDLEVTDQRSGRYALDHAAIHRQAAVGGPFHGSRCFRPLPN